MTQPREFWWIAQRLRDGSEGEPEIAEIHEMSADYKVAYITGLEVEIDLSDVRLIERVLPAGRAAAAVEKLESIVSSSWHVDQATGDAMKVIDILQGAEIRA